MIRRVYKILIIIIFILVLFVNPSCATGSFQASEITLCEGIDQDSFTLINPKTSFGHDTNKIYAAVAVSYADADDNYRFVWKHKDSGKIIRESSDKYLPGGAGKIEGKFSSSIEIASKGVSAGQYIVEYYHNKELIKSKYFSITRPYSEVIKVIMATQVDDDGNPQDNIFVFEQEDSINACVKMNRQLRGDRLLLKLYRGGELIEEYNHMIENDTDQTEYIDFDFSSIRLDPGKYKIELYHNDSYDGNYYFGIRQSASSQQTQLAGEDDNVQETDTQESTEGIDQEDGQVLTKNYSNQTYGISIGYPSGWDYIENQDESGLNVQFAPIDQSVEVTSFIMVFNQGYYEPGDISVIKDTLVTTIEEESGLQMVDSETYDSELYGKPTKEYYNYYTGPDGNAWSLALLFIEFDNSLFGYLAFGMDSYAETLELVYFDMLGTLEFTR